MGDPENCAFRVDGARVEYDLGSVTNLADALVIGLMFACIVAFVGLVDAFVHGGRWLYVPLGCAAVLHAGRWVVRRRGDHLLIRLARTPRDGAEHSYEIEYRGKIVGAGPFSPEMLRVDTERQMRGPTGRMVPVYRVVFEPVSSGAVVHRRYEHGFPVLYAQEPVPCVDQVVALLDALKIDPADVLVRMRQFRAT
jgi:hypothetical protein